MKAMMGVSILLSACAMNAAEAGGLAALCDAAKASAMVGEVRSDPMGDRILKATGAKLLRWISPGMAVTMDYRADRANIYVDRNGKIERISCG